MLGVALLGLALRQWRGRPKESETAALPKWMQSLDTLHPDALAGDRRRAGGVNPKNLLLTVAAAAAIAADRREHRLAGGRARGLRR